MDVTAMGFALIGACLIVMAAVQGSEGVRKTRGKTSAVYREKESDDTCHLEINCKSDDVNLSMPVKLPIRGPRGPQGQPGERGDRGTDGLPGQPGLSAASIRRIAFFAGLKENFGPFTEHTDILFDRTITNIGSAYNPLTGRFTAPVNGVYHFNVVISAQGRQKAAVMVLQNGEMVATVWAESIPYWSTASNTAVLSLDRGDQVWLLLLSRASYLHGYMYTTFSGFLIYEQ